MSDNDYARGGLPTKRSPDLTKENHGAIRVVAIIPISVGYDGGTKNNDRDQTRFAHRAISLYRAMIKARLTDTRGLRLRLTL
jgi:hypothetical protein